MSRSVDLSIPVYGSLSAVQKLVFGVAWWAMFLRLYDLCVLVQISHWCSYTDKERSKGIGRCMDHWTILTIHTRRGQAYIDNATICSRHYWEDQKGAQELQHQMFRSGPPFRSMLSKAIEKQAQVYSIASLHTYAYYLASICCTE